MSELVSLKELRERASPVIARRLDKAFAAIRDVNTITMLSLDEMEAVVLRALFGEFDDSEACNTYIQTEHSGTGYCPLPNGHEGICKFQTGD